MNKEFEVYKLNEEGLKKAQIIAGDFSALLGGLIGMCPEGRELSIVKTKLEEACFFAKKSVASVKENQA